MTNFSFQTGYYHIVGKFGRGFNLVIVWSRKQNTTLHFINIKYCEPSRLATQVYMCDYALAVLQKDTCILSREHDISGKEISVTNDNVRYKQIMALCTTIM